VIEGSEGAALLRLTLCNECISNRFNAVLPFSPLITLLKPTDLALASMQLRAMGDRGVSTTPRPTQVCHGNIDLRFRQVKDGDKDVSELS
jgi:hypothetical protein